MEGETRLENGCAVGAKNEKVRRVRAAQIGGVNRAVRIEHFTMSHRDAVAHVARDFQPHPSDHVLAEIKGVATRFRHGEVGSGEGSVTAACTCNPPMPGKEVALP